MSAEQNNYWQQDPQNDDQTPVEPSVESGAAPTRDTMAIVESPEPAEPTGPTKKEFVEQAPVSWTASEYVHLEKGGLWYVLFAVVVIGFIAIDVFLLKSWTFSILVLVMAVAVIVYARRPPRELQYTLSGKHGLYIGEKLYDLADYKAFGLIRDGEHNSIMLIPTKRFAPGVSVYFPVEVGEKVVDILGSRLPMENLKLDVIDIVVRQLRL